MQSSTRFSLLSVVAVLGLGIGIVLSGGRAGTALPAIHAMAQRDGKPAPIAATTLVQAYGKLPLAFEANAGQVDAEVKFLARGSGYTLFLTRAEAVLSLHRAATSGDSVERQTARGAVLRVKLLGANPTARVVGLDELPGKVNYLIGNDSAKWRSNISTYRRVEYRQVYAGVDLVYYGNQRQLEYDFVVAPGADPNVIRLFVQGADRLELDSRGDLVLHADGGQVWVRRPVVYQEAGGKRHEIAARYTLRGGHQVAFAIGGYDRTRRLVIDPTLAYSTYIGGSSSDYAYGLGVDPAGNAYIAGYTSSANFPTASPFQPGYSGGTCTDGGSTHACWDVFVAKVNSTGSALIYSTYLGGKGSDYASALALDATGSVYVTGRTTSLDFPKVNPLQAAFGGGEGDGFVAKLNPSGSALVYSTYLGGSGTDGLNWIAVDSAGSAYVGGYSYSSNFPTMRPLQPSLSGPTDAVVAKLDPAGSALVYSTYLGGTGSESAFGVAVDPAGNAYLIGWTTSANFPTMNAVQARFVGGTTCGSNPCPDAFVAKLDAAGSTLVYSTFLGGNDIDQVYGIALDSAGNAYVTGYTWSSNFPTASPLQSALGGGTCDYLFTCPDAFVAKLSSTGSTLLYSTYLGGNGPDYGQGIAVDAAGNAYVTGYTYASNFPVWAALQAAFGGGTSADAFVVKLNAAGSALLYSTYLGGSGSDYGGRIVLGSDGSVYVSGYTLSGDFPAVSALQPTLASSGLADAFVAKIREADVVCSFALSATSQTVSAGSATGTTAVTAPSGCWWVAQSATSWLTITSGRTGNGSGSVLYSVATNTGSSSRTGTLTIAGQTFTVTQLAPGTIGAAVAAAMPGESARVSIRLSLPEGVAVDSLSFDLVVMAKGTAPGLTGTARFDPNPALPMPSMIVGPVISVPWPSLPEPLRGLVVLGELVVPIPKTATVGQSYAVQVSRISGSYRGTSVGLISGPDGTITVGTCPSLVEPTLKITLQPGFYIAEVTTPGSTLPGYWGMEVLVQRGVLAGGFNLGGAVQENGTSAAFGAFYLPSSGTVQVRVDAQVIPGGDPAKFSMAVRLLNSTRQQIGSEQSGTNVTQFRVSLPAGFYIVEVRSPAAAPRATFQMGLGAENFGAGVNVGGFVASGLTGFGAFYVPESQEVNIKTLGPTYGKAGASCLSLTLRDASRNVIRIVP